MSAAQARAETLEIYQRTETFFYPDEEYTTEILKEDEKRDIERRSVSMFYQVARTLSAVVALGFVTLLGLSLATGGPIHWAIAFSGCLGSIGLGGAIWLSKFYLQS